MMYLFMFSLLKFSIHCKKKNIKSIIWQDFNACLKKYLKHTIFYFFGMFYIIIKNDLSDTLILRMIKNLISFFLLYDK